jgi:replication factor A1
MNISELRSGQEKVEIEAVITGMEEPREFNKFGKVIRVANATIEDDSGSIKLTLWNQDIEKAKTGTKIKITNGFVNEFKGEKQVTSGKFGKLEFLGESDMPVKAKSHKAEKEVEAGEDFEEELDEEIDTEGAGDF